MRIYAVAAAALLLIALLAAPAVALTPDELLLVVNKNVPQGMELADFYAKARKVPAGHIVELSLPTAEQMPFDTYERSVVPPLREYLRQTALDKQIKCIVTFYGVPFRIAGRIADAETTGETAILRAQLKSVVDKITVFTSNAEALAVTISPQFKPLVPGSPLADPEGQISLENLSRRIEFAGKAIVLALSEMPDSSDKELNKEQFLALVSQLKGPVTDLTDTGPASTAPVAPLPPLARIMLEDRRYDPAARRTFRENAAANSGLFNYAKLLIAQIGYLSPDESEASTDSELAMLHVTFYNRSRWQLNNMCFRIGNGGPQEVMTCRLDAPDPKIVHDLIVDSLRGEMAGLHGKFVIDARGLSRTGKPQDDAYAIYDESLVHLASIILRKTNIPLIFDNLPEVLPAHSQSDVSLYCGWYSVGNYIPACTFDPGAVGFHVASYEMVSLRDPGNKGWVRGLLKDGIAATLGPVSEPYLQSFPMADEFFPLLLTGKLTLAETYWKTTLMTSWRQCLVGDPLYNPYKNFPAMRVEDLPLPLQRVFGIIAPPTTRPVPQTAPH